MLPQVDLMGPIGRINFIGMKAYLSTKGVQMPDQTMTPEVWLHELRRIFDVINQSLFEWTKYVVAHRTKTRKVLSDYFHELRIHLGEQCPGTTVAHANNISSIEYPTGTCPIGWRMRIMGPGFGSEQTDYVILPSEQHWRITRVSRWTDRQIVVVIRDWVRRGQVGFLDKVIQQKWQAYSDLVNSRFDEAWDFLVERIPSFRRHRLTLRFRPPIDVPPSTSGNYFGGTYPEIAHFKANNQIDHVVVSPGVDVLLSWETYNASKLELRRILPYSMPILYSKEGISAHVFEGSYLIHSSTSPQDNEISSQKDENYTYRLLTYNSCTTARRLVFKEVRVHIRHPTVVRMYGIEVIQAIQTFSKDDSSISNVIPLIEGKRTLVRVYAGNGLPPEYGPIGHICDGTLKVTPLSGQGDPDSHPWKKTYAPLSRSVIPHDDDIVQSKPCLIFWLPTQLAKGTVRLTVRVYPGDPWAVWEPVEYSTEVTFIPTAGLDLRIFKVKDSDDNVTTIEEIDASIEKLRSIFPVAYDHGIRYQIEGTIDVCIAPPLFCLDLNDDHDWFDYSLDTDLFDMIDEAAEDITDDVIVCAIVSSKSRSKESGRGWPGGLTKERLAYWVSKPDSDLYIEAHEIGHALNLFHVGNYWERTGDWPEYEFVEKFDTIPIGIHGVDLKDHKIVREIPPTYGHIMQNINKHWIGPAEYLWVLKRMAGGKTYFQMMQDIVEFCTKHNLTCSLNVKSF